MQGQGRAGQGDYRRCLTVIASSSAVWRSSIQGNRGRIATSPSNSPSLGFLCAGTTGVHYRPDSFSELW